MYNEKILKRRLMYRQLKLIDEENRNQCIELYRFLLDNCMEAKGSSHNHQNWEGGYFDHIEEVLNYAIELYELLKKNRKLNFSLSDALLVLFLHDLEKPLKYSKYGKDLNQTDQECRDWFIKKFNLNLTPDHLSAVKYIHGEGGDYRKDMRVMSPLCAFCHCCDIISARIFFDFPKN